MGTRPNHGVWLPLSSEPEGAEDKDVLLAHSGVDQGWAGFRATSNLVHLFDFQNDEEPKASEIQDKRGIFL